MLGRLLEKAKRGKKQMKRTTSLGGLLDELPELSCRQEDHISGHR